MLTDGFDTKLSWPLCNDYCRETRDEYNYIVSRWFWENGRRVNMDRFYTDYGVLSRNT